MLQEKQRESERNHNSRFYQQDEEKSKSFFTNPQYLTNFLEWTNQFSLNKLENQIKVEKVEDKNQEQVPLVLQLEQEPRYVNQKQYHRIMIRRIKRAQQALKMEELRQKELQSDKNSKKYIYESRHQHALKRERGPDGKFLKKTPDSSKFQVQEKIVVENNNS